MTILRTFGVVTVAAFVALAAAAAQSPQSPPPKNSPRPKPPINPFDTGGPKFRGGKLMNAEGIVIDLAGHAIPRATVTIALVDEPAAHVSANTDVTGHFAVSGIPSGKYTIQATAKGYNRTLESGLDVGDDDITVVVALRAGRGTSSFSIGLVQISGTIAGPDGPISDATVRVGRIDKRAIVTSTSRDDGSYRAPNLLPGSYALEVRAPSYRPYRLEITVPHVGAIDIKLERQ